MPEQYISLVSDSTDDGSRTLDSNSVDSRNQSVNDVIDISTDESEDENESEDEEGGDENKEVIDLVSDSEDESDSQSLGSSASSEMSNERQSYETDSMIEDDGSDVSASYRPALDKELERLRKGLMGGSKKRSPKRNLKEFPSVPNYPKHHKSQTNKFYPDLYKYKKQLLDLSDEQINKGFQTECEKLATKNHALIAAMEKRYTMEEYVTQLEQKVAEGNRRLKALDEKIYKMYSK